MTPDRLTGVVHRLCAAVDPAAPQRADADLVRAVARYRDPAAFADIVRRHGPMVLGTCRRVLRDHADADDAFQATFLVFLRRAGELRRPERLAGWLFQVAYRTSQKLRAVRLARRGREVELFDLPAGEPPAEFVWRELRPIFDTELARLPDKLRLPAVLCLLEGRSKRDAARTLGWPEGTVAGRLQQARETLRRRFAARGLTLSAGALAVALFEGAGAVAVPPALFASTIHGLAAGSASAGAAALADGVVHAMFVTKVKALTAVVLLAGVVGTGTSVVLTPGTGPGVALADGPAKEKGPAPRDITERQANQRYVEQIQRQARKIANDGQRDKLVAVIADARRRTADLRESYEYQRKNLLAQMAKETDATELADLRADVAAIDKALKSLPAVEDQVKELELLRNERVELQRELDKQREVAVIAGFQAKNFQQNLATRQREADVVAERVVFRAFEMVREIDQLEKKARDRKLSAQEAESLAALKKEQEVLARLVDPKAPVGTAAQRALLEADVAQLRDRKAYAEQMVRKGFMTKSQLAADTARLAEAEARLAKLDAAPPKGPTADELAAKLHEIERLKRSHEVEQLRERLKQTEELFRKGLVAQAEVDAAKVQLFQAEVELRKLAPPPTADPKRAHLEVAVRELKRVEQLTREAYNRKTVPELEYLRAKLRMLKAEFELTTFTQPVNHREFVQRLAALNDVVLVADEIDQKLSQGFRAGSVSAVELHRSRIEAAALKAELNDWVGQYDKVVGHREAAVREIEELLDLTKAGAANDRFGQSDLRQFRLDMAEAKANLHRAQLRKQRAEIVTIRAEDVEFRKKLFAAGAVAKAEVEAAEAALAEAKTRLAEGR